MTHRMAGGYYFVGATTRGEVRLLLGGPASTRESMAQSFSGRYEIIAGPGSKTAMKGVAKKFIADAKRARGTVSDRTKAMRAAGLLPNPKARDPSHRKLLKSLDTHFARDEKALRKKNPAQFYVAGTHSGGAVSAHRGKKLYWDGAGWTLNKANAEKYSHAQAIKVANRVRSEFGDFVSNVHVNTLDDKGIFYAGPQGGFPKKNPRGRGEYSYETVSTGELRAGDLLDAHGSLFRLLARNISRSHDDLGEKHGPVIWFTTEYLGPIESGAHEAIPVQWRKDWTIQGNNLAKWSRVTKKNPRKRKVAKLKKNPDNAFVIALYMKDKAATRLTYDANRRRFTDNSKPSLYATQIAAKDKAESLIRNYSMLRNYRVTVEPAKQAERGAVFGARPRRQNPNESAEQYAQRMANKHRHAMLITGMGHVIHPADKKLAEAELGGVAKIVKPQRQQTGSRPRRQNPASGPLWEYKDARGVIVRGRVEKTFDKGGTDVTYMMRRESGEVDMLSGARLKAAKVLRNPKS